MEERIASEGETSDANLYWMKTFILMGLRYQPSLIGQLIRGVRGMEESLTYRAILQEGKRGERHAVRRKDIP